MNGAGALGALLLAAALPGAAAPAAAQLEARVRDVEDGAVRFGYEARPEVEVCDQQARLAIGLVAKQASVRGGDGRCRGGVGRGAIHACDEARVLGGATQDRLLVEAVSRIGIPVGRKCTRLGLRVVRVEDHLSAASRCPADGLGIAKALVADAHAKAQRPRAEQLAFIARLVEVPFARIELYLVLVVRPVLTIATRGRGEPDERTEQRVHHAHADVDQAHRFDDTACCVPSQAPSATLAQCACCR